MVILKKGSKGNEVEKLQKFLGCTVDGDFGTQTETLVKKWQSTHGLTADGIVGEKTWNAMFGNIPTNSKCVDPSVKYNPLKVHVSVLKGRNIKYLAIHYTAGGSSDKGKANAVKGVFEKRDASADFCVDDYEMVQFNPDLNNYYCWSVGDKKNPYSSGGTLYGKATNRNTISIEVCSTLKKGTSGSSANHSGWSFTDKALDNAVKLSKILMKKYNIPIENVVRHYDISGKLCPGVIGWNNEKLYDVNGNSTKDKNNSNKWIEFKNRLK